MAPETITLMAARTSGASLTLCAAREEAGSRGTGGKRGFYSGGLTPQGSLYEQAV